MATQKVSWGFWTAGTLVIVLSWFRVVSHEVGWIGFGVALLGSVLSWFGPKPRAQPAPGGPPSRDVADLEKLADLRERGLISEDEFAAQKKKILDRPPA
jgi:hypothetical protein